MNTYVELENKGYGNSTWLTNKAIEYALKDDGSIYTESYPDIASVTLNVD